MSKREVDAWYSKMGSAYFYSAKFEFAVNEWQSKQSQFSEPSNKFLPNIIKDAEGICFEEDFYPPLYDNSKLAEWCLDQAYKPIDIKLLSAFVNTYRRELNEQGESPSDNVREETAAMAKWKNTEDWKISFECGARTLLTMGLEPVFNSESPCRVPVEDGKTRLDAFKEGTGGAIKMGTDGIKDGAMDILSGAGDILDTAAKETWKTVLFVGVVALFAIFIVTKAKKAGV